MVWIRNWHTQLGSLGTSLVSQLVLSALPSEVKIMKTKTWTVITNTGKQAELQSGVENRQIQKPAHISARDFIHWLAVESHIDDSSLGSLFKL
jgi:hypothetical protein